MHVITSNIKRTFSLNNSFNYVNLFISVSGFLCHTFLDVTNCNKTLCLNNDKACRCKFALYHSDIAIRVIVWLDFKNQEICRLHQMRLMSCFAAATPTT